MLMVKVMRQKPATAGRVAQRCGEAAPQAASDETNAPQHSTQDTGTALLQAALTKENLQSALKRVRANAQRWWRNSGRALKSVLNGAYFDRLGVPRFS